jgi:hypothetical protein
LFGLAGKQKKQQHDRLDKLARAIEAVGAQDRQLLDDSLLVDRLKREGALLLYRICSDFVESVNGRLADPALILAPFEWDVENFHDGETNFFQISLRGRLLQLEFHSTEEMYSTEDFRRPYVLHGSLRSFNQESLEHNRMGEQRIFCCREKDQPEWHFFDARSYRAGRISSDYLAAELERLL